MKQCRKKNQEEEENTNSSYKEKKLELDWYYPEDEWLTNFVIKVTVEVEKNTGRKR